MASTVLNFNRNNLITGINVINGKLIWTDDRNEPRSIDIETFKGYNHSSGTTTLRTNIDENGNDVNRLFIDRDITVIRPHPTERLQTFPVPALPGVVSLPFRNVIPRFSYRWRYADNQYSPFAPFSDAAFLPGTYTDENAHLDGENFAMINNISSITIGGLLTGIPIGGHDVVAVDVLYTETISSTIYVVETIDVGVADRTRGFLQRISLNSRRLGSALPPDQLLRNFDNVPLRAKSQESTANRLIYANYEQNFEQPSTINGDIRTVDKPVSGTTIHGATSVKTDRTYDIGIAFIDEFGRQGGMIPIGGVTTNFYSNEAITLTASIPASSVPDFATCFRYFVKDTSGPHYNLVTTDSYNDQTSGTETENNNSTYIWLAFPSRDRNKIVGGTRTDEDGNTTVDSSATILLPRKHNHGPGNTGVIYQSKSQHPVIEIQNEAPDVVLEQLRATGNETGDPNEATIALRSERTDGRFFVKVRRSTQDGAGGAFLPSGQSTFGMDQGTEITGVQSYRISNFSVTEFATFLYTPPGSTATATGTVGPGTSLTVESTSRPEPGAGENSLFIDGGVDTTVSLPGTTSGELNQIWFETEPLPGTDSQIDLYWETEDTFPVSMAGMRNTIRWTNTVGFYDREGSSTGVFIEENTLEGAFNGVNYGLGVRVNTPQPNYQVERRSTGLIYSGLFNDRTNIDRLNEFIQASGITKEIEPNYGSIQKLHTRDTNLIVFTEDKIFRIQADKDSLFNADGSSNVTANIRPLGQTIPFIGEYGISTNPESFATYGHRIFFSDKRRGVVLQLTPSNGQIFEISATGMNDYFRDRLFNATKVIGAYDDFDNAYDITIYGGTNDTATYNLDTETWVSRRSYISEGGISVRNRYYTFKNGRLYKHNSTTADRNNFYGDPFNSSITFIFNDEPSLIKEFSTLGYEGVEGWTVTSLMSEIESSDILPFIEKEGKFYAAIADEVPIYEITGTGSTATPPSISDGTYVLTPTSNMKLESGIKGVTLEVALQNSSTTGSAELFAVNTDFFVSS